MSTANHAAVPNQKKLMDRRTNQQMFLKKNLVKTQLRPKYK